MSHKISARRLIVAVLAIAALAATAPGSGSARVSCSGTGPCPTIAE
jgi:hypothetical protein